MKIAALEIKIQILDVERVSLLQQLNHIKKLTDQNSSSPVTQYSSTVDKIQLFKNLFRGHEDVYPKRWENSKTGKSGYSPVCGNEWRTGVCDKPLIKCSVCENRSFLPVTDQVIQNHLSGIDANKNHPSDFVMGVYPMLIDERCWFLAVNFIKPTGRMMQKAFSAVIIQTP